MKFLKYFGIISIVLISITFSCKEKEIDPSVKAREDSIKLANRKYDIEFEKELIALGIDEDTIVNDFLKVSKPDTFTYLAFFKPIARFNGIEIFKNLQRLDITNKTMNFKSLDVNKNTNLRSLTIRVKVKEGCKIYTENSKALETIWFDIEGGKIEEFDIINHPNVVDFQIVNNEFLNELDFSKYKTLKNLHIQNTPIKKLTLPKESNLVSIILIENPGLESLDLSSHVKLVSFQIQRMSFLSQLTLPANGESMRTIVSIDNPFLTVIDLKKYTNLYLVDIRKMVVDKLDVSGSRNIEYMFSIDNPRMSTICVHPEQKKDTITRALHSQTITNWYKSRSTWWGVCN